MEATTQVPGGSHEIVRFSVRRPRPAGVLASRARCKACDAAFGGEGATMSKRNRTKRGGGATSRARGKRNSGAARRDDDGVPAEIPEPASPAARKRADTPVDRLGRAVETKLRQLIAELERTEPKERIQLIRASGERLSAIVSIRPSVRGDLTRRETEVLDLLGQGLGNERMAKQLYISIETVRDHLKRIRKKLQSATRTEIVRKVLESVIADLLESLASVTAERDFESAKHPPDRGISKPKKEV